MLAVVMTVAAAVGGTFLRRSAGMALVVAASGFAAGVLHLLGSDLPSATHALPPLLLIAGYAALAGVLNESGVTQAAAARLGPGPLPVLLLAGGSSVILSNDIVVVSLAGVVLARESRAVDSAALFVGANMTGALFPQGTPKNVLLLGGEVPFAEYLRVSLPVTLILSAVACLLFTLWGGLLARRGEGDVDHPALAPLSGRQKALVASALLAIAAQPVADVAGVPRFVFGGAVLLTSLALGAGVGISPARVAAGVPWQLGPVVLVIVAGAALLESTPATSPAAAGVATFFVASLATDLVGAALAAPLVAEGAVLGNVALAATTAAAYTTPVGSVAGILLLQEMQQAGRRPEAKTFALATATAISSFVLAAAVLPVLGGS